MKKQVLILLSLLCIITLQAQKIYVNELNLSKEIISRDESTSLKVSIANANGEVVETNVHLYITKIGAYNYKPPIKPLTISKTVTCMANGNTEIEFFITPKNLQVLYQNDRSLTAPGTYVLSVKSFYNEKVLKSINLEVKDEITNPGMAYEASYNRTNPLKDALLPVPKTAIFKMPGYSVWCPSVIKVGDTYHMFCSRWKTGAHWLESHIIRATSKSLFGPYEFQEVVMEGSTFPHKWGNGGLHNPKILKVDNKYLLHFIGMPKGFRGTPKNTGFATAKNITGPWEIDEDIKMPCSNAAIWIHKDGKAYAVGKDNMYINNQYVRTLKVWVADSYKDPFKIVGETGNRLPHDFEHEDATIWWANDQYNVLCTDYNAKVTSEQKSLVYFTSKDGIDYKLYSRLATWRTTDPVPVINEVTSDIDTMYIAKVERPEVFLNEKGEVAALLIATKNRIPMSNGLYENYVIIRPVNNFVPNN